MILRNSLTSWRGLFVGARRGAAIAGQNKSHVAARKSARTLGLCVAFPLPSPPPTDLNSSNFKTPPSCLSAKRQQQPSPKRHTHEPAPDRIRKMAKSLRSKRRRKMRAEKRLVNAKKELVKLKQVTARLHGPITRESLEANIPHVQVCEAMQVDPGEAGEQATKKVSKKEQMRINTQWMSQRKIKSIKSKIKKHNKKKTRKGGSAGLSSRKAKKSIRK